MVDARAAGTIRIGDTTVPRMGFGAMRLPGPGVWGPPPDRDQAIAVVRRAVECGVRVIDTAWYYGLDIANEIVAAAIRPYPDDLLLVTKLGGARRDDGTWYAALSPDELRAGNERDRRVLGVDTVPVTHLRWMEGATTFDDALGTMIAMREEGLIGHIGLSNVSAGQLDTALARTPIVSVSNMFGLSKRDDAGTLARCTAEGIAYLPFFPLGAGNDVAGDADATESAPARVAARHGATPAQIVLAWMLSLSPVVVAIPGTGKVAHLEENIAAAGIGLTAADIAELEA